MGKVTAETSFKHLNAGTKFDLGAKYTSPLVDLSKPFNTIKKIVRQISLLKRILVRALVPVCVQVLYCIVFGTIQVVGSRQELVGWLIDAE